MLIPYCFLFLWSKIGIMKCLRRANFVLATFFSLSVWFQNISSHMFLSAMNYYNIIPNTMVILHPGKCSLTYSAPWMDGQIYLSFEWFNKTNNKYLCKLPGVILSLWQTFSSCVTSKPLVISKTLANAKVSAAWGLGHTVVFLCPDTILCTLFFPSCCSLCISQCSMALPLVRQVQCQIKSLLPRIFFQRNLRG